ncbi:hypothetical protein RHGRI_026518 [Rhododendron griersonianum]|uniref:Uncharacterized protein n=1 Tax=Rhododendron griersonianum TaxID=479676 RepID=A0AAV6IU54_9ERIC|nr:hypothetical protein RHGRI_026518 [Rhododendron griersonianum]
MRVFPPLKTVAKAGITCLYVTDFNLGCVCSSLGTRSVCLNDVLLFLQFSHMLACSSHVLGLVLAGSDTGLSWFALWFFPVAFGLPNMKSHLFFGFFFLQVSSI